MKLSTFEVDHIWWTALHNYHKVECWVKIDETYNVNKNVLLVLLQTFVAQICDKKIFVLKNHQKYNITIATHVQKHNHFQEAYDLFN